jgi:hypothetical protein
MGPTDAECAVACVDLHGSTYVLVSGKTVYTLSDPENAAGYAGHKSPRRQRATRRRKRSSSRSIAASPK